MSASPVTARHRPRIEALLAATAELVDETPTGTCMRAGCCRVLDHLSPSPWFCSQQHSIDWQVAANGGVTVLVSRLTVAESLMKSHVSDPVCGCGCVELFVALTVAASEDEGMALDARAALEQTRTDIGQYARDLAQLRAGFGDNTPGHARHTSDVPMTGDPFDISGLPPPVETRVLGLYQSLRRPWSTASESARSRGISEMREASVNCGAHAGPCEDSPVTPFAAAWADRVAAAWMIAHIPAGTIDLSAGQHGNARARRRWRRFWKREFPNLRFWTRRQSS